MRGAVSPLRVTLILTVPHLQLKRAGIQSLSSRTGNTSTYIPASSTLLILLWCLRFSRYIYTMICVAALCRTSSSPLLKLNNTPIISPKLTSSNANYDMILMILVNRHTFNWSGNAPTWFSKCMWPHIERQHVIAFLWALWFIMRGNQHCMQWSGTSRICFLFCSLTYSSFVIMYLVRTVCSLSGRGAGTFAVNSW